MVLGEALQPKPGPQEAPGGPNNTQKHTPYKSLGNQNARVSMSRSAMTPRHEADKRGRHKTQTKMWLPESAFGHPFHFTSGKEAPPNDVGAAGCRDDDNTPSPNKMYHIHAHACLARIMYAKLRRQISPTQTIEQ